MVGRQREFLVLQYGTGFIQVIWAKKTCPVTTYQGVVRRAEVNRLCRTIPPLRRIKIEATKVVIIGRSTNACLALIHQTNNNTAPHKFFYIILSLEWIVCYRGG
jgi:hypothetical protein